MPTPTKVSDFNAYEDPLLSWMEQTPPGHFEPLPQSIGSPSGEHAYSMIPNDTNGYEEHSLSWTERTPSGHLPSGERVNSMIGNDDNAYKEPVEKVANPDESSNFILGKNPRSILGKRPRSAPTGELDPPFQALSTFRWRTLAELYNNDKHAVHKKSYWDGFGKFYLKELRKDGH
ncbi:hypothetical protein PtA15_9A479 [Puccinia triticina]|uniref:Uncharacterized protein n=1 Tax=Puccinia triticina TaxID=208348 RepID=A0ABY7CWI7_9BASI|nr:uncharacterized protein PtA15_9A479 [Puccinia triticina]WAQ88352.1 hypothetical protein PtA15_9A479 [Puccinia triticina]